MNFFGRSDEAYVLWGWFICFSWYFASFLYSCCEYFLEMQEIFGVYGLVLLILVMVCIGYGCK